MGVYDAVFKVTACNPKGDISIDFGVSLIPFMVGYEDRTINIALDQSTSQIGICVTDADTDELLVMADVCNLGFPSVYEFKQYFLRFMRKNFGNSKVNIFWYEIPVEHGGNLHVRKVLNALRDFISEFPERIESLRDAWMIEINNLVWKTHYLKDPEYAGRRKKTEDVKVSAMQETIKRFPNVERYCYGYPKPPDSCDAVGIMYGGLEEIRASFGKDFLRINKTMTKTNAAYEYEVLASDFETLQELIDARDDWYSQRYGWEVAEYNPKMTIQENCSRWVSTFNRRGYLVVTSPKAEQVVRWESKIEKPNVEGVYYVIKVQRSVPKAGLR